MHALQKISKQRSQNDKYKLKNIILYVKWIYADKLQFNEYANHL